MGTSIILTGSNPGAQADIYQGMQKGFLAAAVVFLLLSILLFLKFELKDYFLVIMRHNQKRVSEKNMPKNMQAVQKTPGTKETEPKTEQLSGEETALLEQDDKTEVLSEEQLVFTMGTSVELYTEILNDR